MLSSAADIYVAPMTRLFRALGDGTRLRIVALLSYGELCVCHIETALGLNQSTASRQLGILKAAGIVTSRRDGNWIYYSIDEQETPTVQQALDVIVRAFGGEKRIERDHAKLRKSCGPSA